jgi:hypothetical protein
MNATLPRRILAGFALSLSLLALPSMAQDAASQQEPPKPARWSHRDPRRCGDDERAMR